MIDEKCSCCRGSGRYESSFDGHRADYDPCLHGCARRANVWYEIECDGCSITIKSSVFFPQDGGKYCEECMRALPGKSRDPRTALQRAIQRVLDRGHSVNDIAHHLEISPSTVRRWLSGESSCHPLGIKAAIRVLDKPFVQR
jgi:hypothetical protein